MAIFLENSIEMSIRISWEDLQIFGKFGAFKPCNHYNPILYEKPKKENRESSLEMARNVFGLPSPLPKEAQEGPGEGLSK